MKIKVDIITGFIESGKTKLINDKLRNEDFIKNRIVIIQCEKGQTDINYMSIKNENLFIENIDNQNLIDEKYINKIIEKYGPNKIIIEANGMKKVDNLLKIFDYFNISRKCFINEIIHIIDVSTFDIFMNNMGEILINQISNSDFIILKNTGVFNKDKLKNIERTLKKINNHAKISEEIFIKPKPKLINSEILLLMIIFFFTLTYLVYSIIKPLEFDITNIFFSWLQRLNTVFISILIQALSFILIGIFVSSILQVFVSSEKITKIFPKNKTLQFIVAIFAGLFFPVCDCAVIPVGARLIKKGIPVSAAVTFILAAPIINPITIASTLYAFPNQPIIAVYRVCLGVIVALLVGIAFIFGDDKETIFLNNIDVIACNCELCNVTKSNKNGIWEKVLAIFRNTGVEFFQVGKFLIVGSFISSLMQTTIPKYAFRDMGGGSIVSLLIMMLFAFVLSVCSTSDAFIARTFVNQFPLGAIIGFLVLGPMIDIKNLLMLIGSFKKSFVIKLIALIFIIAFEVLFVFTNLI